MLKSRRRRIFLMYKATISAAACVLLAIFLLLPESYICYKVEHNTKKSATTKVEWRPLALSPHGSLFGIDIATIDCYDKDYTLKGIIRKNESIIYLLTHSAKRYQPDSDTLNFNGAPVVYADDSNFVINRAGEWLRYCIHAENTRQSSEAPAEISDTVTPIFTLHPEYNASERQWAWRITECQRYCELLRQAGVHQGDLIVAFNRESIPPNQMPQRMAGFMSQKVRLTSITLDNAGQGTLIRVPAAVFNK